jgi:hypothetical protein
MQHAKLYALEGFGLTGSSDTESESTEEGTTEWMTLEAEDGGVLRVRLSGGYVRLESHQVPARLELVTAGVEPEIYARIEVDENRSRLGELRFLSTDPDSRGVRQSDLRAVEVAQLLEDFVALFTLGYGLIPHTYRGKDAPAEGIPTYALEFVGSVVEGEGLDPAFSNLARSLRRSRHRDITPALLEKVAEVYRGNFDRAPTKAVEHHFQVSQRMAAEYVSRARGAGMLPPTSRGKKQA